MGTATCAVPEIVLARHAGFGQDSINDGYFVDGPDPQTVSFWGDLPASYHGGAGDFSFADGQSEMHLWRSITTRRAVTFDYDWSGPPFDAAGRQDFLWTSQHMVERY